MSEIPNIFEYFRTVVPVKVVTYAQIEVQKLERNHECALIFGGFKNLSYLCTLLRANGRKVRIKVNYIAI